MFSQSLAGRLGGGGQLLGIGLLLLLPVFIQASWMLFWFSVIVSFCLCLIPSKSGSSLSYLNESESQRNPMYSLLLILVVAVAAIALAYTVSRSDLDDAFYVAVASFTSSNPDSSLLLMDPMLGENNIPLIFPSYRFASFELLSGALAYLFSVPAMDVYYIYLLPVWVFFSILAIFLLTRELLPKDWLVAGVVTVAFILLFGEMPRSPANFSFFRLFQGKAVFLSVVVPAIFYLTARYFSFRGTSRDLFLLGCCQIAAVGLSNFGMLAAPVAGFSALVSNIPLVTISNRKVCYRAFAILFIPLPYLVDVALNSQGSSIMLFGNESAERVWNSVFGPHQQYLIAVLLVIGPLFVKDNLTRWRLAAPSFILFAFYLNPWLADFISKYITTPPVYWRVTWSFPILIFAAVSLCIFARKVYEKEISLLLGVPLIAIVFGLAVYSVPFNTLRQENIGNIEDIAAWKISRADLGVAKRAAEIDAKYGRLLAPDEIAGVISRFETHPPLVVTRALYLELLKPLIEQNNYKLRKVLYEFVTGKVEEPNNLVVFALQDMNVSRVVIKLQHESPYSISVLKAGDYKRIEEFQGYAIWVK